MLFFGGSYGPGTGSSSDAWPPPMSLQPSPSAGSSVLALTLRPGYSGFAFLDGFGERAFGTCQLSRRPSDRPSVLVRLIQRLVGSTRPTCVAIGVSRRDGPEAAHLRRRAARLCRDLGLDVVIRPLATAFTRLGLASSTPGRNALARHLTQNFVPGLMHRCRKTLRRVWYRRPAWHALALAVSELVNVAPFSAAALVPAEGHRLPAFQSALRDALPRV